jgi:hypothetical protein
MFVPPFFRRLALVVPLAGLLACQPDHPTGLPTAGLSKLHGTWLLVSESSRADTLVYRRNTYRFKYRAGGRPGFRLRPAGLFTRFDVAPGGGLQAEEGTWAQTGAGRLLIHLPDLAPAEPDYELEMLSYKDGQLKLRRLQRRPAVEVIRQPE